MTEHEQSLLDDLLALDSGLTAWEVEFIDNLDKNWRGRDLTEKQEQVLHRIAKKADLEN